MRSTSWIIETGEDKRMTIETTADFMERVRRDWPSGWRGRPFKTKDIGRAAWHHWVSEALTVMAQTNLPEKVLSVERVRSRENRRQARLQRRSVCG